jgi:hypothetical protein
MVTAFGRAIELTGGSGYCPAALGQSNVRSLSKSYSTALPEPKNAMC